MRRHWKVGFMLAALLIVLAIHSGNDLLVRLQSDAPSRSSGTSASGAIANAKRLPASGENFVTYSRFGSLIGRTCVHGDVRDAVVAAYATLADEMPQARFTYGETGWCWGGGRMRPHRTHQNGLSVDFMVPVVGPDGEAASFPAWPWTKFGYGVEFDADGRSDGLHIDFDAIAAHLLALDKAARARGLKIRRVIFAPKLRQKLFATPLGREVRRRLRFMKGRAWVRHDEHYHVDFSL